MGPCVSIRTLDATSLCGLRLPQAGRENTRKIARILESRLRKWTGASGKTMSQPSNHLHRKTQPLPHSEFSPPHLDVTCLRPRVVGRSF